ncbi:MAG TPA: hypothetical protein VGV15_10495, partial [Terriglobales bacterium]|nr:hypothetical protein [Terriglobales bacterium]
MPTSSLHRFVCFVCVSFSPIALVASTIHVPLDQPTIQQAIGVAVNGDIVLVSPGTYKENIDFKGKAITVQSSNGPAGTMIDGGEKGPAVTFATNEGKTSVLTGFTIRNGSNANGAFAGGGISITQASPTISGNIITANSSCNNGAAIQSSGGSPVIRNNLISGNFQAPFCFGDAGSVLIGSGTGVQLVGNVISGNPAGGVLLLDPQGSVLAEGNMITNNSGAGITWRNEFSAGGPVTLVQNLVAGNEGTGVSWDLGPIVLVNNTIANNAANFNSNASEIFASVMNNQVTMVNNLVVGAINASTIYCVNFDSTKRPIFNNNDIFSAAALAYAGTCPDLTGTNGNLSADPLFRAILS